VTTTSAASDIELNYFNYFTELEEAFIRRRQKHLWLSPVDWALMESWRDRGVPLHVAIRGIERAFDSYESKPRHRTVKSLMYCREEVEAQYAEWLEGQVGSAGETVSEGLAEVPDKRDEALPFPRNTIMEHLQRAADSLAEAASRASGPRQMELATCFERAAARVREIQADLAVTAKPDAQKLEESLTHLERMIGEALKSHAPEQQLAAARAFAEEQLAAYKKKMDKEAYEETLEGIFSKRIREDYGLPRLSLFYL
jgi:hypothetical protein